LYELLHTFIDWEISKSESNYANRHSPSGTFRIDNNSCREATCVHPKITKGALRTVSYVFKEVLCAHVRSSYFQSWTASVVGRIGAPMPSTRTAQTGQPWHLMLFPCTHICTTRKCNKCSCNDRHETAILPDPVVIHDHCSLGAIAPQNANIKASSSGR
jgi:hypothetical protein